jgi:hypothetical protein
MKRLKCVFAVALGVVLSIFGGCRSQTPPNAKAPEGQGKHPGHGHPLPEGSRTGTTNQPAPPTLQRPPNTNRPPARVIYE